MSHVTRRYDEAVHIREGVRPAGPRLFDRGRPGVTLCGAPLGSRDVRVCDIRDVQKARAWACSSCLDQYRPNAARSRRKPYNDRAGYVASRRNDINRGWVVIYRAAEQGIDVDGDRYAVVCETHATIVGMPSVPKCRPFLKIPEFCEACMESTP